MNQKLEEQLQLALATSEEDRERTEDLNVGFDQVSRTWELIVKYHGSLEALEQLNVTVEYLLAGYALLTVPEELVERVAEFEQIEYVEKPKRFFYEAVGPAEESCIAQVTLRDPFLSGKEVLIAILDSGIEYQLREFRKSDGSTRIRYLWDQTLQPSSVGPDIVRSNTFQTNTVQSNTVEANTVQPNNVRANTVDADGQTVILEGQMEQDLNMNTDLDLRLPPAGFSMGVEFSAAQIDQVLAEPNPQTRFQMLPSVDTSGHGTAVAGIAVGSSANYQGVARDAELLIVKLGFPNASSFPRTTEIMRGVTYVVNKAIELQMPLVINLSFGNSYGAHDGTSLLERFLDNAAEIGRTVICVGSGNEGANSGHLAGSLTQGSSVLNGGIAGTGTGNGIGVSSSLSGAVRAGTISGTRRVESAQVELAVAQYERSLNVQLWKNYSDVYRIFLRSPGGQETELSGRIQGGKYTLQLEQTSVLIFFGEPAPYSAAQEIYMEFLPTDRPYIDSGIWTFILEPVNVVAGNYYFYLPSGAVRSAGTGFYRSTPEATFTIPSTASKVVTVGAYDSTYDAYADFSGRGYGNLAQTLGALPSGMLKPDLVAPGVNILAPDIYGGFSPVTGTSFATPIVSGSAALLMEWGIVRGNDPFLYGEKVKAYLHKGAQPLRGENVYPNARVGWGKLCVAESLPV